MAILLIGLNHRTAPVEMREQLYLNAHKLYPVLTALQNDSTAIEETAIVSTCNRFEVYVVGREIQKAEYEVIGFLSRHFYIDEDDLRPALYIKQSLSAINHLMRVTAGIDSMVLGEDQIIGQVGTALECATTVSTSGTVLHRLFEQALHTGKRARTETAISRETTSVSHAAAQLVNNRLEIDDPYVVVIGAGEMAELAAQATRNNNTQRIAVLNRTFEHGVTLAEKIGGEAFSWSRLSELLTSADVVISATGAPHTVLFAEDMQSIMDNRAGKPLVMVDVAVPRDIDAEVRHIDGITLYDIDDLQEVVDANLAQREACIPAVEAIIAEELQKYNQWLNERNVVPVIKDLRRDVQDIVESEVADALQKLDHLGEYEQEVIKRMAHRIMNKVLHSPTVRLREVASNGDAEVYAGVVRELFALSDDASRLFA